MLSKTNVFGRREEIPSAKDARPGTPAVTTAARMPAQNVPPTPAVEPPPATATAVESSQGSRLLVGPEVKLKGAEIHDCDTLVVEGRVEATMDSRVIQIAERGAFSGKVGIDVAEIWGLFDGELTARKQLVIHSTGRVSGTIRYGKIVIEEGGELSGDVKALASDGTSRGAQAPLGSDGNVGEKGGTLLAKVV